MGKGFEYNFCADGVLIKKYGSQKETACCVIEYIFNQSNADDLKEIIFDYYQTDVFDASGTSLQFNGQKYNVKDTCWAKEKFWVFQILVCYNINEIINNRKSIENYSDLDQYRNNKFWIESASGILDEKQKIAQHNAIDIVREWTTIPVKNKKHNNLLTPSEIARLVGKIKNDDEIKKLKAEILDGIKHDWCDKLQFCLPLEFTDKKGMTVNLSMKNIVNRLVEDDAFFPQTIRGILVRRYETMERNCRKNQSKENWDDKENNLNIEDLVNFPDALLGIPENYFTSDFWRNFFTKYNNIGHDMPMWLYYENITEFPKLEDRPRVMIVSQDPLRNNHNENKVYLSTPFGFHSLDYLQTKDDETKKSMVRMFVHLYLRQGYIVYLTDVMKLFGCDRKSLKKLNELKEQEPHKTTYDTILKKSKRILKKEIEYFNPDFIVSLGGPVAEALTGAWNDKKNDHRNRVVPLLNELCHDLQNTPSVYVRYHTNARSDANLHFNDPKYWYVEPNEEQTSAGDQDNDITNQGGKQ